MKRKRKIYWYRLPVHLLFIFITVLMILPLVMVVSISFSSEKAVTSMTSGTAGFSFLPKEFTLDAYKMAFKNPEAVIKAYGVTAYSAILGTLINMISVGMCAYPLARNNFDFKGIINKFLLVTMLFSGGTIPTYIVFTKYYHLGDNLLVYILPAIAGGAWNTFMLRTYMRGLSESLYESAEIDGASELTIFFRIAMPLSVPMIAAISFMTLVGRWGDWGTSLIYMRNPDYYTLQYLLQRILNNAEFLKGLADKNIPGIDPNTFKMPSETLRYAMVIIAAGPMLLIFPFFQKYFSKGLTVGSIKG